MRRRARDGRDGRGVSLRQATSVIAVSPSAPVGWEKAEARGLIQVGILRPLRCRLRRGRLLPQCE